MRVSRRLEMLGLVAISATVFVSAAARAAASYPDQKEADYLARDFKFQTGEVLPELRLHYTTLGTPQRDGAGHVTNAVLMLHGTTGTGKNFLNPTLAGELFGPGQVLDASKYYVILPDGVGRGGSSKPSDGLHAKFPRYGYNDVVEAQHLLVTKGLGVDHLRAVVGTSMGGMQTWMWGERWPDMMDALLPVASQPSQISGRNLIWRRMIAQAIRNDPEWNGGDYKAQPKRWTYTAPVFLIMTDSPVRLQKQGPTRKEAEALYDKTVSDAQGKFDTNDYLYWYESSWDYDPEPDLAKIKAPLVAVNFADDEINPPDLGVMEKAVAKIPRGRSVLVPESEKTIGHQTLTLAAIWKPYLEELMRSPVSVNARRP